MQQTVRARSTAGLGIVFGVLLGILGALLVGGLFSESPTGSGFVVASLLALGACLGAVLGFVWAAAAWTGR